MIANILINGLITGGVFAILALGFALVFGVAKILNLAHTAFYMIAAFFICTTSVMLGLPLLLSAVMAVLFTGFLGMGCYKLLLDRVKKHETAVMIISLAVGMLFQELLLLIFSGAYRRVPPFIPGFTELLGVRVSYQHLLAIVVSGLVLIGIWALLNRTRLGKAVRAVAEDYEIANVMGINVSWICTLTNGISAGLAGVAGAVVAPLYMVQPYMWMHPLIMVLAAVVLGGLGSAKGSVIAALILGFAETLVIFLVPGGSFLRGAISLCVMVAVLMLRPEGLFGVVFEEERL